MTGDESDRAVSRRRGRRTQGGAQPVDRFLHGELKIVGENGDRVKPGEMGELWVGSEHHAGLLEPSRRPGHPSPTAGCTSDAARRDGKASYLHRRPHQDMYISGGRTSIRRRSRTCSINCRRSRKPRSSASRRTWGRDGPRHRREEARAGPHRDAGHRHCRERLAIQKCPTRVMFIDALPRSATGKVHKPTLRTSFLANAKA